jgi:hypothetical protein
MAGIAGVAGDADYEMALAFITRPNGAVSAEKMRITSDGNVGIGTTPSNRLHVVKTGSTGHWATKITNNYNSASDVSLELCYANSSGRNSGINLAMDDANSGEYLLSLASGGTTRFKVDGAGDVEITATQKLYLDGGSNTYFTEISDGRVGLYANGTLSLDVQATSLGIPANFNITDGTITVTETATGWAAGIVSINTNADASPSMLQLEKISASPADNDYMGGIIFKGRNDAAEAHNYVEQWVLATDVSNGSETSRWAIGTWGSGTEYP